MKYWQLFSLNKIAQAVPERREGGALNFLVLVRLVVLLRGRDGARQQIDVVRPAVVLPAVRAHRLPRLPRPVERSLRPHVLQGEADVHAFRGHHFGLLLETQFVSEILK